MTPFALTEKYADAKTSYVLELIAAELSSRIQSLDPNDLVQSTIDRFEHLSRRELMLAAYYLTIGEACGQALARHDAVAIKRLSKALRGR